MTRKKILITGASGFLGSYILKEILRQTDNDVVLLIRQNDKYSADERVQRILYNFYGNGVIEEYLKRIKTYPANIEKKDFGLCPDILYDLRGSIDEIFHAAANTDFRMDINTARQTNVLGADNILQFSSGCFKNVRLHFISTAFISGAQNGMFSENDSLKALNKFNNAYEQSKFEAELLVEDYRQRGLDVLVYRPSIIMGEHETGKTTSFKMFYQPLQFFYQEFYDFAPMSEDSQYNFMPVDICAKIIVSLSLAKTGLKRFHIVNRNSMSLGLMIDILSNYLHVNKPKFVDKDYFFKNERSFIRKRIIEPFIPYFNLKVIFGFLETYQVLEANNISVPDIGEAFLLRTLKFCQESGFLKKIPTDTGKSDL